MPKIHCNYLAVHQKGIWDYATECDSDWTLFGSNLEAEIGFCGQYTGWLRPVGAGKLREYPIWHVSSGEKRQAYNWPLIREENNAAA